MALVTLSIFTFSVTDAVTGLPVQGALCELNRDTNFNGEGVAGLTDASGVAVVEALFSAVVFAVSKPGFITVTGSPTLQINVALQSTTVLFSVNILAGPGGTVNPSGFFSVQVNEKVTVTATPDAGFVLDAWIVNAVDVGNTNPKTFTIDRDGTTIAAAFKVAETPPPPPPNGPPPGTTWPVIRQIHVLDNFLIKAGFGERAGKSVNLRNIDTAILLGGRMDYTVTWEKAGFLAKPTASIEWNDEALAVIPFNVGEVGTVAAGSIDLTGRIGAVNSLKSKFEQGLAEFNELRFDVWVTLGYSSEPLLDPGVAPSSFFGDIDLTTLLVVGGIGVVGLLLLTRGGTRVIIRKSS